MNDNTKVLDQNPSTPQVPIQPISSSGANKEIGHVSEYIRPSGAELVPNIPPEVSVANVKVVQSDKPELTSEHVQAGLTHSEPVVPTAPTGLVKISQTGDINNSDTWQKVLEEKVEKVLRLLGV